MNPVVTVIFVMLILIQIANATLYREFALLLIAALLVAALYSKLAGAVMQFARLIHPAFDE